VEILSSACWGGVERRWPGFACDGRLSMSRFIFTSKHFSTFTGLWFWALCSGVLGSLVPCVSKFQFRLLAARNLFLFKYPLPPPRPVGILVFSYCPIQMGKATLRTRGTWPICPDSARSLFRFRSCRERWSPPLCSCSFAFSLALSFSSGLPSLSVSGPLCLSLGGPSALPVGEHILWFYCAGLARTSPGWPIRKPGCTVYDASTVGCKQLYYFIFKVRF